MSMSPQTQKEVAKLIQMMKELLMGFGGLFKKNHGRDVATFTPEEMQKLHHNTSELAKEQRELAATFEKDAPHKALYLNTRAEIMDAISEEISPENLAKRAEDPLDVSPEQFEEQFQKRFEKAVEERLGKMKDHNQKAAATIAFHNMDINEMQKLDQELVEKRFNIGNKAERPIFAGLAAGSSSLKDVQDKYRFEEFSPAKANDKGLILTDKVGLPVEKGQPKNEPGRWPGRNQENEFGPKSP